MDDGRPADGAGPPSAPTTVPADLVADLQGDALHARISLIGELREQGIPIEEIRTATRRGRLSLLQVESQLRGTPTLSTRDLIARTGVDPELLERVLQAAGVPIPEHHEPAWQERDVALAALLDGLAHAGIAADAIVELAQTLGESSARIGAAAIIGLGAGLTRSGDTEYDLAARIAHATAPVDAHLGDALALLVRTAVVDQLSAVELDSRQIAGGRIAGASPVTIGFADVVGFTRMGEQLGAQRLQDVAARLGTLAAEVTDGRVRVVKTIGDAVMLAGPRPLPVVTAMLALQERVAEDDDFPRIRAGVATGDAVPRAGDWFGPPVNLAARVCATARPETVLVDDATRQRIGDAGLDWTGIGRVRLKGVGRVPLHRVRGADDGRWRSGVHPSDG